MHIRLELELFKQVLLSQNEKSHIVLYQFLCMTWISNSLLLVLEQKHLPLARIQLFSKVDSKTAAYSANCWNFEILQHEERTGQITLI